MINGNRNSHPAAGAPSFPRFCGRAGLFPPQIFGPHVTKAHLKSYPSSVTLPEVSGMHSRRYLLWIILLALLAVSLYSQTAVHESDAVTTIRTKFGIVLVDVVVTNGKGEPVAGLHQKDFELQEDGKPQTISTFEEHHGVPLSQIKLPPMPPNIYTNFPLTEKADSVNVLLLDALNTPSRDQTYVHEQMIKYLETIPAGTRVAVFTLASRLRMLQGVTTDSAELLAALNDKKTANAHASSLLPSSAENEANQHLIDFKTNESV